MKTKEWSNLVDYFVFLYMFFKTVLFDIHSKNNNTFVVWCMNMNIFVGPHSVFVGKSN